MSVTKNLRLPISIGQRYVIYPIPKNNRIGFILPLEFRDVIIDYPTSIVEENYFFDKKRNQEALWIEFDKDIIFSEDEVLFTNWKTAAKRELDKTRLSGFKRNHNPYYYKLAANIEYRQTVLNKKS